MTRIDRQDSASAEPLSASQPPRSSIRDWSARQRTSAGQALRYSRFVVLMKRLLPIAAIALVASVIAYSLIPRAQDRFSVTMQKSGKLLGDLTMTKPRFTGTDGKGNPFTVTAEEAIQDPKSLHRATLRQVQADMQFDQENWMNASAGRGVFDMDAGTLKLTGGIALFTDSGYELHTPSVDVFIRKNLLEGSAKVTGHGPLGKLSADSFRFDRTRRVVKLSGHVHMIMYPKKAKRR
jgi:lipopolysaccharide export system protein LptC